MSNRVAKRIVFDPQEVREMREAIPSLRKRGKSISVVELSEFLGMNKRTLYRYEEDGAPMQVKYMYAGVRHHVEAVLKGIDIDLKREAERLHSAIEEVSALRDSILNRIELPK